MFAQDKRDAIDSFIAFTNGGSAPAWPLEVFLELSNLCNLKCAMCPTFSGLRSNRGESIKEAPRGFLPLRTLLPQLDSVLRHALNVHCFGYGEPTLHPEFEHLLTEIAAYEVMIDFFTNGMQLSERICQTLVRLGVYSVTISFSGSTKEEYESVYLGGVHEQVLAGIRRLVHTKRAAGSRYPRVSVNSLAFEHHVGSFDSFVQQFAELGVDCIELKQLQAHTSIPELRGHASVYRPWIDGPILERAMTTAQSHGVSLSVEQYVQAGAIDQADWIKKKQAMLDGLDAETMSQPPTPIAMFRQRQASYTATRPEQPTVVAGKNAAVELGIETVADAHGFYCMEPFKTLYFKQDAHTKPCCFSSSAAPSLGWAQQQEAKDIWDGPGYRAIREGILQGQYSTRSCGSCLKSRIGPQRHYTHALLEAFSEWYTDRFATDDIRYSAEAFPSLLNSNAQIVLSANQKQPSTELQLASFEAMVRESILLVGSAQGVIQGHLERIEDGVVHGWAWSPLVPEARLQIELLHQSNVIATIYATRFRQDLANAGIGDGKHGFRYRLPQELLSGINFIRARTVVGEFQLSAVPLMVRSKPIEVPSN